MKKNVFRSAAVLFAGIAIATAGAQSAQATAGNAKVSTSKEINRAAPTGRIVTATRNKHGGFSGDGSKTANRFLNQRQYRKHLRSNPCLLRSKKLRTKKR